MTNVKEKETMFINDPLFSHEALADYHIKLERPAIQKGHQMIPVLVARFVMDGMT